MSKLPTDATIVSIGLIFFIRSEPNLPLAAERRYEDLL